MTNEPPITITGNLTADVELKFIQSGAAVASFTIASTPKKFNKQTQQFEDGETLFMRCSVWREQAENAAESLSRGMRVVATGQLVSRSWTDKEGQKRTVMEMQVDEVAPSLRWATAKVVKAQRGQQPQQSNGWGQPQPSSDQWATPAYNNAENPF